MSEFGRLFKSDVKANEKPLLLKQNIIMTVLFDNACSQNHDRDRKIISSGGYVLKIKIKIKYNRYQNRALGHQTHDRSVLKGLHSTTTC